MGDTGEAVHDQHDLLALVAEILGDGGGAMRGAQTQKRRAVGRHRHDAGAVAVFAGHHLADEIAHFARPLPDQSDDDHIGIGVARHHLDQDGFADTRSGDDAKPLTPTHRQRRIDDPHTHIQRLVHRQPRQRVLFAPSKRPRVAAVWGQTPVERHAFCIHHATKDVRPDADVMPAGQLVHPALAGDPRTGLVKEQQVASVGKADHLAGGTHTVRGLDAAARAGAGGKSRTFEDQPVIAQHPPAIDRLGRTCSRLGGLADPGQKIGHLSPPP